MRDSALWPYLLGLLAACVVTLVSYRISHGQADGYRVVRPSGRQLDAWFEISSALEGRTSASLLLGEDGTCPRLSRELQRIGMARGEFQRTAAYMMDSLRRVPEPATSSASLIQQGLEAVKLPDGMPHLAVDMSEYPEPLLEEPLEMQLARRLLRRLPGPDRRKVGR